MLSPKLKSILTLRSEGKTNKEIGFILGTSEQTIKNYCKEILAYLGAHNMCEGVSIAYKKGILSFLKPSDTIKDQIKAELM